MTISSIRFSIGKLTHCSPETHEILDNREEGHVCRNPNKNVSIILEIKSHAGGTMGRAENPQSIKITCKETFLLGKFYLSHVILFIICIFLYNTALIHYKYMVINIF